MTQLIKFQADSLVITVEACRTDNPRYADRPWWVEIAVGEDQDDLTVFETNGMFISADEAQREGKDWLTTTEGRTALRKAVARMFSLRRREGSQ